MSLRRDQLSHDIRTVFADGEYLAHTVAYNSAACAPGQIIRANDGRDYHIYPVNNTAAGLSAYILVPRGVARPELTILFRGTKDTASKIRDGEEKAPGHRTFYRSLSAIYDALAPRLAEINREHPDSPVSISIDGHSLGAADAQYMYVELMDRIREAQDTPSVPSLYSTINRLTLLACNAAGVTQGAIDKAKRNLAALKNRGIQFIVNWLHAAGDIVQQSGQGHIFSDATIDDGVNITLLKIFLKGAFSEKLWSSWFKPSEILAALCQVNNAHRFHYFSDESLKNDDIRFDVFTNKDETQVAQIHQKLSRHVSIPPSIQWLQKAVTEYLHPAAESKSDGFVLVERDNKADTTSDIWLTSEELDALEEKLTAKKFEEKKAADADSPSAKKVAEVTSPSAKKAPEENKHAVTSSAPASRPLPPIAKLYRHVVDPQHPVLRAYVIPAAYKTQYMDVLFPPKEEHKQPVVQPLKMLTYIPDEKIENKHELDDKHPAEIKPKVCTMINETIRKKLIGELNKYINSRCDNENPDTLNWSSWFFRSKIITTEKVKIMLDLREKLKNLSTVEEIKEKILWYKNLNTELQDFYNKKYHARMESDLVRCLKRVEATIADAKLTPTTYHIQP